MELFDLFAKISLDTSEYDSGLEKASGKMGGFASGLESAFSGVKTALSPAVKGFQGIEAVGKKAGGAIVTGLKGFVGASTAVAGFGGSAIKAGMDFDAAMSQVTAISGKVADEDLPEIIKTAQSMGITFKDTGDATSTVMDILRNKAIQMGATTQFSATEAAEAMSYMAMAGWKGQDMLSGISGIMDLAAASGEDLATTSDIVTDALTAFGLTAGDSGHFADVLAAASSNANTNVGMMGETFKYVAPLAGAMGYSAEDTALAVGLMANSGIKASQAGTNLRSIMTRMVKPTKESSAAMDALGISITKGDGSMKPFGTTIEELRTAFAGLSEEEKTTYAAMLGGQEAMSGLLAIVNAAPGDVEKLTTAIRDCDGAAKEMAATMMDNLAGDIKLFKSALESLQISVSDALNPTLREFTQFGTKAIEKLTMGFQQGGTDGFFSALTGIVSSAVVFLADKAPEFVKVSMQFIESLATGILNARWYIIESASKIISILLEGIDTWLSANSGKVLNFGQRIVDTVFSGFTKAGDVISNHIGQFVPLIAEAFFKYHESLFTVGIEILGAIGRGLTENKDKIAEMASNTVRNIALSIGENAPAIIDGAIVLLEALANAFAENWPLIAAVGMEIIAKLVEGVTTSAPAFGAAVALLFPHIAGIIEKIGGVVSIIGEIAPVFGKVVEFASGGITKILGIGKTLMSGIQGLFSLVASHPIVAVITAIVAAVIWLWNNCEEFREAVKAIWDAIVSFFQAAGQAIQAAFEGVVEFFQGVWEGIVDIFQNVGEWFGEVFAAAGEAIQTAWAAVVEFFQGVWDGIVGVFQGVGEFFAGIFSAAWDAVKAVWDFAISYYTALWEGIQNVFSVVVDFFRDIFTQAWEAIKAVWDTVADFFSTLAEGIRSVFSNVMEAVSGFFKAAWEAVQSTWNAAVDFFSMVWEGIQAVFSVVADVLGGFFSAAWEAVVGVWQAAGEFFASIWETIVSVFQGVAEWFGGLFSKAWEAITSAWQGVGSFFSGIWKTITGAFSGAWNTFVSIGKNIVQGLWSGVQSLAGWLWNKISGWVQSIWKGVLNFFGIHSPSKKFEWAMKMNVEGSALGFEKYGYKAVNAVTSWSQDILGAFTNSVDRLDLPAFDRNDSFPVAAEYKLPVHGSMELMPAPAAPTTVIINSPKAVDPIQAAREWKKTTQRMTMAYL